jgi:hypothetical protein
MSARTLAELVKDKLETPWRNERERLDRLDCWYRWDPRDDLVKLPRTATPELKALLNLAKVPWLGLVVTSTAQCLFVDGYRSALDPVGDHDEEPHQISYGPDGTPQAVKPPPDKPVLPEGPWRIWISNGMDRRQAAIYRAALAYGYAFVTVLPGEDPMTGEAMPVLRGVSPRKMYALYEEPAEDDFPVYAMRVLDSDETDLRAKVYDDQFVYTVQATRTIAPGESPIRVEAVEEHGAGVCPVVRYCNELDLDGRTPGEIEPHIPLAARINKTAYDRMLVQHFNSWKIRYIAGLAAPETKEEANRAKMQLRQDDLLIVEDPDTKIGSLPETMLQGFLEANGADIEQLAAVTQTPTHELTGQLVNLSAEALAAARASQTQKVSERQRAFGAGHVQALRLAAHLDGDTKHAEDITGRVTWQDTSIRSMAQAVDALGKARQMLGVPEQALWGRIPGVEKSDVEEWIRLARQADPIQQLQAQLGRQGAAVSPATNPGTTANRYTSNGTPAKPPTAKVPAGQ